MKEKKEQKLIFLRKGVRSAMESIAEDNATVLATNRVTVAGVVRSIAAGKWFRPDLNDVPFVSLGDVGESKASQVSVDMETYGKLCKIAVDIGFASIEALFEDFAAGAWEVVTE